MYVCMCVCVCVYVCMYVYICIHINGSGEVLERPATCRLGIDAHLAAANLRAIVWQVSFSLRPPPPTHSTLPPPYSVVGLNKKRLMKIGKIERVEVVKTRVP